jgi:hypothetical protein
MIHEDFRCNRRRPAISSLSGTTGSRGDSGQKEKRRGKEGAAPFFPLQDRLETVGSLFRRQSGRDGDPFEQVEFVKHFAGTERHAGEGVFGDDHRQTGFVPQQGVDVA